MSRNILLRIEYDGSGFAGWQRQKEVRTVQGVLEAALLRVCAQKITLHGASRTDAGVHARAYAASFLCESKIPTARIPYAANNLLSDIKILSALEVPLDFHARYSAKGKTYIYKITCPHSGQLISQRTANAVYSPDIFLRNYRYVLNESLNTSKMEAAALALPGTHDFAAFCTAGGNGSAGDTVRTLRSLEISQGPGKDTKGNPVCEVEIRASGDGFLYNMVRIIAGTLVSVGLGKRAPAEMADILSSRERARAGPTAPPGGLYLTEVYYDPV